MERMKRSLARVALPVSKCLCAIHQLVLSHWRRRRKPKSRRLRALSLWRRTRACFFQGMALAESPCREAWSSVASHRCPIETLMGAKADCSTRNSHSTLTPSSRSSELWCVSRRGGYLAPRAAVCTFGPLSSAHGPVSLARFVSSVRVG
jgi:hypothetical protein